jgi:hypothetical protein
MIDDSVKEKSKIESPNIAIDHVLVNSIQKEEVDMISKEWKV